jgi:hypothetical protein
VQVNVLVPFERCPHITVVMAFLGFKLIRVLLIFPLKTCDPALVQHVQNDDNAQMAVTNSEKGWMTNEIKQKYLTMAIADDSNQLGACLAYAWVSCT